MLKFLYRTFLLIILDFLILFPVPISRSSAQVSNPDHSRPYYKWVEARANVTAYVLTRNPTALGTRTHDGIVACNSVRVGNRYIPLPLRCWMYIPMVGRVFHVEDRMRDDFQGYADVWMSDYDQARLFGKTPGVLVYILLKNDE